MIPHELENPSLNFELSTAVTDNEILGRECRKEIAFKAGNPYHPKEWNLEVDKQTKNRALNCKKTGESYSYTCQDVSIANG